MIVPDSQATSSTDSNGNDPEYTLMNSSGYNIAMLTPLQN
jgi:hypothetical protein